MPRKNRKSTTVQTKKQERAGIRFIAHTPASVNGFHYCQVCGIDTTHHAARAIGCKQVAR